jgi:predicted ATPase/class 3 adenylate cyclase
MNDTSLTPVTGYATILFTDIQGSTELSQLFPDTMPAAILRHHDILHRCIKENNGYVFEIIGDAFCASFSSAIDAINAAGEIQKKLISEDWGETPIKIRIGLNSGDVEWNGKGYTGYMTLSRTQRIMSTGHGGQIIISNEVYEKLKDVNQNRYTFRDMGERKLKSIIRPEHLYQVNFEGLPNEFPPLKTLDARPNNLPVQPSSFVGRKKEMSEIKRLLKQTHILTLIGSGGTGKSRISIEIGTDMIDDFTHGVWFVELAPLFDPSLASQEIASVFNLKESGDKKLIDVLIEHLKDKQLLLILDNCEHLINECANLTNTLVKNCPNIKIIASTREALKIDGETIYRIPSLSVPVVKGDYSIESLLENDSVRLFTDRALSTKPDFRVTDSNVLFIARLCNNLDGIPFAIELAAARVRSLPVEKIAEKLNDRFKLLTGGSRTALPRQQTLRAMMDWSYELLTDDEKAMLRRLSVFAGGWKLETSEEICSDENVETYEVIDVLGSLIDKSLVVFDEEKERYFLQETVRQYGIEKLSESSEDEFKIRHSQFFLSMAEEAEPHLTGSEQRKWTNLLEEEHDNLRVAIGRNSLDMNSEESVVKFGAFLWRFWYIRGYLSEGRKWLKEILGKFKTDSIYLGNAFRGAGVLARSQGDYLDAKTKYDEALRIYRDIGNKEGIANILNGLALISYEQGNVNESKNMHEQALMMRREINDKRGIASSLHNLGDISSEFGDYVKAKEFYSDALNNWKRIGDKLSLANTMYSMGNAAYNQGEYLEAEKLYKESIEIFREAGDDVGVAYTLSGLGNIAEQQGNHEEAIRILKDALKIFKEAEDMRAVCNVLLNLGLDLYQVDKIDESRKFLIEGLLLCREIANKPGTVQCISGFCRLAISEEQNNRAVCLLSFINTTLQSMGTVFDKSALIMHEQTINSLREKLSDEEFSKFWEEGKKLSIEQAVELALKKEE